MQLDRRQKAAAEQGISLTGGSVSMPSKPPATFATRSQPVTPAGGELWSPPAPHATHHGAPGSNSFAADIFGSFSKEPIPPPVDPFKSSTSSISSKDIFDPFQSATAPQTSQSVPATVISPPPVSQPRSSAGDFADFDSAFGGSAPEISPLTSLGHHQHHQPAPTLLPLQPTEATAASASKEEPKVKVPQVDRYAALAELDELFSGQVRDRAEFSMNETNLN